MAKLTQFGRMRRRIKRELDAARTERALSRVQMAGMLASGAAAISVVQNAVITRKTLAGWDKAAVDVLKAENKELRDRVESLEGVD